MHRIIEVKPLKNYRIWIKFSDGIEGTVDLSSLVGKGVFSSWKDEKVFNSVYINPESHTVTWDGDIDLCPDTLYAKILDENPINILKKEEITSH